LTAEPAVIVVMGVAGAGKTTVGAQLAAELGWTFYDGDDLHPPENVRKMAAGQALDDHDRLPWLRRIAALIASHLERGVPAVFACSALKRAYRELLLSPAPGVALVYLKGDDEQIAERLRQRRGHFMPPGLLRSQLADLEEPDDALVVDVSAPPAELVGAIVEALGLSQKTRV
jgi:gluconokinase